MRLLLAAEHMLFRQMEMHELPIFRKAGVR
jgi:hypothetical protein